MRILPRLTKSKCRRNAQAALSSAVMPHFHHVGQPRQQFGGRPEGKHALVLSTRWVCCFNCLSPVASRRSAVRSMYEQHKRCCVMDAEGSIAAPLLMAWRRRCAKGHGLPWEPCLPRQAHGL